MAANNNIISIFETAKGLSKATSPVAHEPASPVTVRVESVTAKFHCSPVLWQALSELGESALRTLVNKAGIDHNDWYLASDRSLVLIVNNQDFNRTKEAVKHALVTLHDEVLAAHRTGPAPAAPRL